MAEEIASVDAPYINFQGARDLDLDLGSGQTLYNHASLIDLYQHTEFHQDGTTTFFDLMYRSSGHFRSHVT